MRYIIMHKNDAHTEAGELPPPELMAKMGAFIGEQAQAGRFLGGEGLPGSKARSRLRFRGGDCTVKHGPYAGEHELPAVIFTLRVRARDEALAWAQRYGKVLGDGELELGPVNEPWDLGMMPRPEHAPLRFLLIVKADAGYEAGQQRAPAKKAELTRLETEMTKAGVLIGTERLQPSLKAKRLVFTNHELRVVDGPFAESKELIGGFAVLRLDSDQAALELCKGYAAILGGTLEIDIRQVVEAAPADTAERAD